MIIYKTTNKVNGKYYIGQDKNNNTEYLGSGLLLERAINKYGKENFIKEVIEYCESLTELDEKEIFWIGKLNARDTSIGYNIAKGGTGGDTISKNPRRNEIRKNKSIKNIEMYKDKTNHPSYGKICTSESNKKRSDALTGIKRSDETKRKQSLAASGKNNSAYGKKWIHNKELKINKLVPKTEYKNHLGNGWEVGALKKHEK